MIYLSLFILNIDLPPWNKVFIKQLKARVLPRRHDQDEIKPLTGQKRAAAVGSIHNKKFKYDSSQSNKAWNVQSKGKALWRIKDPWSMDSVIQSEALWRLIVHISLLLLASIILLKFPQLQTPRILRRAWNVPGFNAMALHWSRIKILH